MRLAARNLLILPAVGSALKFQQQQAPKAPAVALNRRQLLTLPAAALALPQSARADQAWAGPRWAEVDTKLPTNDQARVFRDLEDGFEVAYPSNNWMRTQPLPELLGGAPPRGTRFAATDLGQGAVIAVTCCVEINQCVRPAWRYYLLFWPPRRSARVLGVLARGVLGFLTRTF